MIKAIFWDNDGVLVDTERLHFLATRRVLASVGIPLTREHYIELYLVRGKSAFQLAAEKGTPPDAIKLLREERNILYSSLLRQEDLLIPEAREVIEALHGTYTMGIVTSSKPGHFRLIHEKTGLLPFFHFVITAGDYTHSKPHPEPYLLAVERSGFRKEECLVVEDSERGLTAAIEAGIRCIVVPNEFTRGSNFAGAEKVLKSVKELLGAAF